MVLGSSYVKHLDHFISNRAISDDLYNLGFAPSRIAVHAVGISGGSALPKKSIQHLFELIPLAKPSIVFLQIGGNDLSNPSCDPSGLAKSVLSLGNFLAVAYPVQRVLVGETFLRFANADFAYNTRVSIFNESLLSLVKNESFSDVSRVGIWRHREGFLARFWLALHGWRGTFQSGWCPPSRL